MTRVPYQNHWSKAGPSLSLAGLKNLQALGPGGPLSLRLIKTLAISIELTLTLNPTLTITLNTTLILTLNPTLNATLNLTYWQKQDRTNSFWGFFSPCEPTIFSSPAVRQPLMPKPFVNSSISKRKMSSRKLRKNPRKRQQRRRS